MKQGDIILTPVPQADGKLKNRPAIILREMPPFADVLDKELACPVFFLIVLLMVFDRMLLFPGSLLSFVVSLLFLFVSLLSLFVCLLFFIFSLLSLFVSLLFLFSSLLFFIVSLLSFVVSLLFLFVSLLSFFVSVLFLFSSLLSLFVSVLSLFENVMSSLPGIAKRFFIKVFPQLPGKVFVAWPLFRFPFFVLTG